MKRRHSIFWSVVIGIALTGILALLTSSDIIVGSPQNNTRTTYFGWPAPFGSVAVHTENSMQDGRMLVEESNHVSFQWVNLGLTFFGCVWVGLVTVTLWERSRKYRQAL